MRSTVQALIWDEYARSKWYYAAMLVIGLFPMLIYASISSIMPLGSPDSIPIRLLLEVSIIPMVTMITLLASIAANSQSRQMYLKPLSNLSITSWKIGSGSVFVGSQLALLAYAYNALFDAHWPVAGVACFGVAMWAVIQPLCLLGTRTFTNLILSLLPIICMLVWLMARFGLTRSERHEWLALTPAEFIQLAIVFAGFCVIDFWCIALERCGESASPSKIWSWIERVVLEPIEERWMTDYRKFHSPSSALYAYHWRLKGRLFVWGMAGVLLLVVSVQLFDDLVRGRSYAESVELLANTLLGMHPLFVFCFILFGMIMGLNLEEMTFGRSNSGASNREADAMGSFMATRPLSNRSLSQNLLAVQAMALVMSFAILEVTYGIAELLQLVDGGKATLRIDQICLLVLVAWTGASNLTAASSTGAGKNSVLTSCGLLLLCAVAMGVCYWLFSPLAMQRLLVSAGVILSALCLLLTVLCYVRSLQQGYVRPIETLAAAVVCVLVIIGGLVFFRSGTEPGELITLTAWFVALGSLSVLPVAATPLALAANRHR